MNDEVITFFTKQNMVFLFGFPFNKNLSSGNGCFTSKIFVYIDCYVKENY